MKIMTALTANIDTQDGARPKFRHELKYLVSDAELAELGVRLRAVMEPDPHADENGDYLIRSIYLDDWKNSCMFENEDGTSPREKWRIRTYQLSDERISLECKRKEGGMIQKKACLITRDQMDALCDVTSDINVSRDFPPLLNRFILLKKTQRFEPKVVVEYLRKPFICANGNVRVTFDMQICSSSHWDMFFEPDMPKRPIMPLGQELLEVKYDEYIPDHIYHAIQMRSMRQETFSKYYLCRHYAL